MVRHLIGLSVGIALAFGRGHMDQHRTFAAVGGCEGAHHLGDVVAVDRTHVGEAQLLEHGAHLWHRQPAHALLEPLELGRKLPVHEGQVLEGFLSAAGEELQRRAQPHAVQVGGEGAHRG